MPFLCTNLFFWTHNQHPKLAAGNFSAFRKKMNQILPAYKKGSQDSRGRRRVDCWEESGPQFYQCCWQKKPQQTKPPNPAASRKSPSQGFYSLQKVRTTHLSWNSSWSWVRFLNWYSVASDLEQWISCSLFSQLMKLTFSAAGLVKKKPQQTKTMPTSPN